MIVKIAGAGERKTLIITVTRDERVIKMIVFAITDCSVITDDCVVMKKFKLMMMLD